MNDKKVEFPVHPAPLRDRLINASSSLKRGDGAFSFASLSRRSSLRGGGHGCISLLIINLKRWLNYHLYDIKMSLFSLGFGIIAFAGLWLAWFLVFVYQ